MVITLDKKICIDKCKELISQYTTDEIEVTELAHTVVVLNVLIYKTRSGLVLLSFIDGGP